MNSFKAMYCRIYQFVFRTAMPMLPYREPKILKRVDDIAAEIIRHDFWTALLVTDDFLKSSGATKKLETSLEEAGIKCIVYDRTSSNPTADNVEEALELYTKESCQCLIAFGGGSVIDCAKAVGARIAHPNKSLKQLGGLRKISKKLPTLFAVPTTAGTGSEVTATAVITDSKEKHKYIMNSFPLIPEYAVLDHTVTYSLPSHLTATTGMAALTYAIEAYIGQSTTKETHHHAKQAIKFIFKNLELAYKEPTDSTARRSMLYASYYAGIAFSKSHVGYIHAVAHSLGGQYNIPHSLANSVLLPIVLEEYGPLIHKQLRELGALVELCFNNDSDKYGAQKFISAIKEMNARMGIPKRLSGIKEEDIPVMARHADKEANPLYPVPKLMDAKELEKLYYKVSDRNHR